MTSSAACAIGLMANISETPMNPLPPFLKSLDGRKFKRLDSHDPLIHSMAEEGLDKLVDENKDAIAVLLQQAGLLERTSCLKTLAAQHEGGQFRNIDVLFAEVTGVEGDGEFSRFVIVEDKLAKNAEQRREVLAQILDYARDLQSETGSRALIEYLRGRMPEWTSEWEHRIRESLADGDLLLVLVGDQFDPRLVELVNHYSKRLEATNLMEVCMVSLGLYRGDDDGTVLVIPNLVGAVTRGGRDLTVTLRLMDHELLQSLPIEISRVEDRAASRPPKGRRVWNEEAFFAELASVRQDDVEVARRVVAWAANSGLDLVWSGGMKEGWLYASFGAPSKKCFVSINTKGLLWVNPVNLQDFSEFREAESRVALIERLNRIPGVSLSKDMEKSWGSIPLATLADQRAFDAFVSIAGDVYQQVSQSAGTESSLPSTTLD